MTIKEISTLLVPGAVPANPDPTEVALEAGVSQAQAASMIAASWAIAENWTRRAYRGLTTAAVFIEVGGPMVWRWPVAPYPDALTVEVLTGGTWETFTGATYIKEMGLIELEPGVMYKLVAPSGVAAPTYGPHVTEAVRNLALYQLVHSPARREYRSQSAGDSALTREAMMGLLYGSGAGALLAGEVIQ
jgi:hypothetical protein